MTENPDSTSERKKEHINLCLTDDVSFKHKSNGLENYDFIHHAATEVEIDKINFCSKFLNKKINFPFLISCMTGGTNEAENINAKLAEVASSLNIPLGVGSQRQALENKKFHQSYKIIRKNAPFIPILGNIGASQIASSDSVEQFQFLVDLVEADALVIHLNPLQELMQEGGQPSFKGLQKKIRKVVKLLSVPVIVKEVGAGISYNTAKTLLDCGIKGIDVAGAGGTSWAGVEILRSKKDADENIFWDWGLPTSFCIKEIKKLKKNFSFNLIGSGGIGSAEDCAKALALGADIVASARPVLQELSKSGVDGVKKLITDWFEDVRRIMFLTGSQTLKEFQKNKIIRRENLY